VYAVSPRRSLTMLSRQMIINGILLAVLVTAACAPVRPFLPPGSAGNRPAERLAKKVPARPGAAAWSPDGSRLACLASVLTIIDLATSARTSLTVPDGRALAWPSADALLVLAGDGERSRLVRVNARDLTTDTIPLDRPADALHAAADGNRVFLLAVSTGTLRIGTDVKAWVDVFDLRSGAGRTVYTFDRILPAAALDRDRIAAWTHAGPNPLDGRLLVLEHLRPPVVASYSRVLALDGASGKTDDLAGQERRSGYLSGSWSPDGRRLALTTDDGRLLLRSGDGSFSPVAPAPAGWYPTWNPAGSSIYIGGGVVGSDGSGVEELLEQAVRSIGIWSPDGTRLAVLHDGDLILFSGFSPSFRSPDGPLDTMLAGRLGLLRELLRADLITLDDYRQRRRRLLDGQEAVP